MKRAIAFAWIIPIVVFVVLMVLGARAHPLWGDEAETALFGLNIVRTGVPYGWDGTNIMGINNAVVLNENLINHTSPWLQYYLAALGLWAFGHSSLAARLPFMAISLITMLVLYQLTYALTKRKTVALLALIAASTSIQFILFSYQARHYMPSILGSLCMLWGGIGLTRKRWWYPALFAVSGIWFFYANYVSFLSWYVAVFAGLIVYYRIQNIAFGPWMKRFALASGMIVVCTAPWYFIMDPLGTRGDFILPDMGSALAKFWGYFSDMFLAYNYNNIFPLIFMVLVVWTIWRVRHDREKIAILALICSIAIVYAAVMSGLSVIVATDTYFTDVRYTVPYMTLAFMLLGIVFAQVWAWQRGATVIIMGIWSMTMMFASFELISLPILYLSEVMHPYLEPDTAVAMYLRTHANTGDTAWLSLDRDYEPLMFALGNKIRFVNRVTLANSRIFPKNRRLLPRYVYNFTDAPDWVIYFSTRSNDGSFETFDSREPPAGIDVATEYDKTVLPVYFSDMTRPELQHRSFMGITPTIGDSIYIFHKKPGVR